MMAGDWREAESGESWPDPSGSVSPPHGLSSMCTHGSPPDRTRSPDKRARLDTSSGSLECGAGSGSWHRLKSETRSGC
jgi:hypothetical protein